MEPGQDRMPTLHALNHVASRPAPTAEWGQVWSLKHLGSPAPVSFLAAAPLASLCSCLQSPPAAFLSRQFKSLASCLLGSHYTFGFTLTASCTSLSQMPCSLPRLSSGCFTDPKTLLQLSCPRNHHHADKCPLCN